MEDTTLKKVVALAMGVPLAAAVALLVLGFAWPWLNKLGIGALLAAPATGVLTASVAMAKNRKWRLFWIAMGLLALLGVTLWMGLAGLM